MLLILICNVFLSFDAVFGILILISYVPRETASGLNGQRVGTSGPGSGAGRGICFLFSF